MIRPYNTEVCENYWVTHAPGTDLVPPEDAFWQAYGCACGEIKKKYECRFKIRCIHTEAPTASPFSTQPTKSPSRNPTPKPTALPSSAPTNMPTTPSPTLSPVPYDCVEIDMEPCTNVTMITYPDRPTNQDQNNLKYWETKLYSEQKGYEFVAMDHYALREAGMAFINLA